MRRENDAYFTPAWMTRALLAHVPEIGGQIIEPCVGDCSIARVLGVEGRHRVYGTDIAPMNQQIVRGDASSDEYWTLVAPFCDWVITNPPYEMPTCTRIVERAVSSARVGVAMMLRISFLEPTAKVNPRGPFLDQYPPSRVLVMPRHSFTGNGKSDSATTAWMIWSKVPLSGPPVLSLYRANERYAAPWQRAA